MGTLQSSPSALPHALRRQAAVAVALSGVVFVLLAWRYAGNSTPGRLDNRSQSLIDSIGPGDTRGGDLLMGVGDAWSVVVLSLLLAGICVALRLRRLAVVAVVGPGLAGLLTTVSKPLIGRTLDGDFAYPSGHAGGATALGLVAALVVVSVMRPGPAAAGLLVAAGAVLLGGSMAFLLVAGDVHYPTDAIGGFCAAVVAVLGSALAVDALGLLRDRRTGAG
ncbi:hypothetical protein [Pseudonocardia sp. KRD291]|uniref:hypothetical protein n=1 Tax=Pseudonocardia sp. KRD291 TaxID=2792007 RepID=UPI001C4A13E5|nr:hypothetical protein [Pseudonocardia sp. KRD291]MBW0101561.1 hypothetical protein [Pseudonocardia sp. KRD291]